MQAQGYHQMYILSSPRVVSLGMCSLVERSEFLFHFLSVSCPPRTAAILVIPSRKITNASPDLPSLLNMPSISSMNKADLVAEIRKLGGHAEMETRKLELQQQLIALKEENGDENVLSTKAKQQSDYQRLTSELTKASSRKATLVKFMKETLGLNASENSTIIQLTHQAMGKVYDLAVADATDPVGFGVHGSLSYAEILQKEPEYCRWVTTTSKEGQANPRLHRLAQWLSQQDKETQETPKTTKWKPRKEGYQKTVMSSGSAASSSGGTQSSQGTFQREMLEAIQALRSEVAELQEDRRGSRPRKENHVDEEMSSADSFQKVSSTGKK